ncbi:MAG: hypothetical protein VW039_10755 [Halieaceae bacterium]
MKLHARAHPFIIERRMIGDIPPTRAVDREYDARRSLLIRHRMAGSN